MEDEDEDEDSESHPPQYTPPEINASLYPPEKVVIIEPTPETEHPTAGTKKPRKSK